MADTPGGERIRFGDSLDQALYKLSEGNPGALTVLVSCLRGELEATSGFALILYLDALRIYGHRIWKLYKDCCGENPLLMERVLRAWQMGRLSAEEIHRHIDGEPLGIPFDEAAFPSVKEMLADLSSLP